MLMLLLLECNMESGRPAPYGQTIDFPLSGVFICKFTKINQYECWSVHLFFNNNPVQKIMYGYP